MTKQFTESFNSVALIVMTTTLVTACGKGPVLAPLRAILSPISVEAPPTPPVDPGTPGDPTDPNYPIPAPCEFWTSLPSATGLGKNVGDTLQLFESLGVAESKGKK